MKCYFHSEVLGYNGENSIGVICWAIPELGLTYKERVVGRDESFSVKASTELINFLKSKPRIGKRIDLEIMGDDWVVINYLWEMNYRLSAELERQISFSTSYVHPSDNPAAKS